MDPNLVYSRHRDDAFASQLVASQYDIFVAMPFRERFSYRSRDVLDQVIKPAAVHANTLLARTRPKTSRRFGVPHRADDAPQTAQVIDDEIIKKILHSHVTLADLTFANDGVLLEVGAALALKPTTQVVLITQGSPTELHFDIRNNAVIPYSTPAGIDTIAKALAAAAGHFESDRSQYLDGLKHSLSADAVMTMNWLGRLRTGKLGPVASLHDGTLPGFFWEPASTSPNPTKADDYIPFAIAPATAEKTLALMRFKLCTKELLDKRLIWNNYTSQSPAPGTDSWSYRGTRLAGR